MRDDGLLARLRLIAGVVILAMVVLVVVSGIIGRFLFGQAFPADSLVDLGTLIGALVVLVGVDVPSRFRVDIRHRPDPDPAED